MSPRAKVKLGFQDSIEAAEHLVLRPGLQALKRGEGKGAVTLGKAVNVLGSVDIDRDCLKAYPQSSRWDYVIGVARNGIDVAHFIEVHSAETSEVRVMAKKLAWLFDVYLPRPAQVALSNLPRQVHWVSSGRNSIPATTPQARYLATTLRKKYNLSGPNRSLMLT